MVELSVQTNVEFLQVVVVMSLHEFYVICLFYLLLKADLKSLMIPFRITKEPNVPFR